LRKRLSSILKGLVPRRIRLIVGDVFGRMFWWLRGREDIWQRIWKQQLDTLKKGGSLEPDPGLVGDREYITRCILDYYGAFGGLTVLGAGCGTGRIEAWLAHEGAKVVCLDHFVEALQISRIHAQRMNGTEDFVVGDLELMPFRERTFDCIYSGGVLEHFKNPRTALLEYLRVTKPKGVIIVSVPNLVGHNAMFGMKPLTELVLRKGRWRGCIEQNFSARGFKKVIEESGFRCLDLSPTFFNAFDYSPFRYLRKVLSVIGIYHFCCRFLAAFGAKFPGIAFGYSFMIALAQRPER
jgi:2-polyprenyl-3-methyl-5-hydroxy-6-metoxy-1,4-benzoquinol methylase